MVIILGKDEQSSTLSYSLLSFHLRCGPLYYYSNHNLKIFKYRSRAQMHELRKPFLSWVIPAKSNEFLLNEFQMLYSANVTNVSKIKNWVKKIQETHYFLHKHNK